MKKIFTLFILLYSAYAFAQSGKGQPALPALARVAYVNIDTLEYKYTYLREKRIQFSAQQEKMESQLANDYDKMQSEAKEVEARAQADSLTQTDYDAATKRLTGMQKDLEDKKQAFTDQLTKDQDAVNAEAKARLDSFLAGYNKTHHYDCILSYSNTGSSILFISKELDITDDVIAGMNKLAEKGK